jgi:hypothetical protein
LIAWRALLRTESSGGKFKLQVIGEILIAALRCLDLIAQYQKKQEEELSEMSSCSASGEKTSI